MADAPTGWWLLDYGNVVTTPQPEHEVARLVELAGVDRRDFDDRYWGFRGAYDGGASDESYWTRVCDRPVVTGTDELDALVRADNESWSYHRPEVLDLLWEQRHAGRRLAMLSNAPLCLARWHDDDRAVEVFERRFYSAELGLSKPDPRIYERVLMELGARPEDVTFVDDRAENVDAASELGIRAVLFGPDDDLGDLLLDGS